MSIKDQAKKERSDMVRALAAFDRESEKHKKIYEDLKDE